LTRNRGLEEEKGVRERRKGLDGSKKVESGMERRRKRKGPNSGRREMEGARKGARPSTEFFSRRCDWASMGAAVDTLL
jgi:hypothetical protein